MATKKHNPLAKAVFRHIRMVMGAVLAAAGLEFFLIPNDIIDGGVVGISIMSSYLSGLPLGVFIFALNLPFLFLGYKQIGKTFAISTLFSVTCLSIAVTFFRNAHSLTSDLLLATVFGGITLGCGVGLIIRSGGSLDGTEIVAIIMDKRTGFSIGEIVMMFNLFILGASGFVFGWERAMYSLITYFIAFKVIDVTVDGIDEAKAVTVITDRHKDIAEAIRDRLGRGVTYINGRSNGGLVSTTIIYVVVSRLEIAKVKSIIEGFDENALMTIGSVEVAGKRYMKKSIH
jgi:uncharacterized membrane-anchored protein YitT (DUF2179 family)